VARIADGTLLVVSTPTIESLRSVPLFAGLDDHALEHIADLAGEFPAQKGQLLIERGQPGMGLFLIEEGTVAVEIEGGAPVELGPGDFFGEIALLTDHHRTARVRAVTEVQTLAISRKDLSDLLSEHPEVAIVMLREVARRLASML
jgi:CRP-like cAMP-binding protein